MHQGIFRLKRPGYKYVLAIIDLLALNLSYWLALSFHGQIHSPSLGQLPALEWSQVFFLAYSLVIIVIFHHENLYKINVFLSVAEQIFRLGLALLYGMLGLAILSFFTKATFITESRFMIVALYLTSLACTGLGRVFFFRVLFLLLVKRDVSIRNALIVGSGKTGKLLAANVSISNPYGVKIVGFLDDEAPLGSAVFMGMKVIGRISDGPSIVSKLKIAEVLVALDNVTHDVMFNVLEVFRQSRAAVKMASPLYGVISQRIFTERYGEVPVVGMMNGTPNGIQAFMKRVFDLVFAFVGMVIFSPLYLAIAIAIKFDSPGSVLHTHKRIGKNGRAFRFYKFRSMYLGSDEDEVRKDKVAKFIHAKERLNGSTKIVDDQKVTRVGKFIRKTSLDELPQLLNVLKGEMSLVGPRPCLPYEWEYYEAWHKKRLSVVPGCTGVWQVNGRSEVGFDDMVILDLYYINNASLSLDIQLILKTIPVMIFGKGAK